MNDVLIAANRKQLRKAADIFFADGPLGHLLRNPRVRHNTLDGRFDYANHAIAILRQFQHMDSYDKPRQKLAYVRMY